MAHYNNGDFEAAIIDLRKAARSGSPYSMLWLFLAQSRVGQEAIVELSANSEKLDRTEWPAQIVELYLGGRSVSVDQVVAESAHQQCEADFYAGELYLLQGQRHEAISALRSAVEFCPKNFYEYAGAVAELERIAGR